MSKRTKTAEELRAQINALQVKLDRKERAERERIGREMQRRTGKETWDDIAAELFAKVAKER